MPKPTKEEVRAWLGKEVKTHKPPPTPEEVRRQLGWDLLKDKNKQEQTK